MFFRLLASTDVVFTSQTLQEGEQLRAASPRVVRLVVIGQSQGSSSDSVWCRIALVLSLD